MHEKQPSLPDVQPNLTVKNNWLGELRERLEEYLFEQWKTQSFLWRAHAEEQPADVRPASLKNIKNIKLPRCPVNTADITLPS